MTMTIKNIILNLVFFIIIGASVASCGIALNHSIKKCNYQNETSTRNCLNI